MLYYTVWLSYALWQQSKPVHLLMEKLSESLSANCTTSLLLQPESSAVIQMFVTSFHCLKLIKKNGMKKCTLCGNFLLLGGIHQFPVKIDDWIALSTRLPLDRAGARIFV